MQELSILDQLRKLESMQVESDTRFFRRGLFPSRRFQPVFRFGYPDNSMFFTGSILLVFKFLESRLSPDEKSVIDKIADRALVNWKHYANARGVGSYNFYETNPPNHFPNSFFLMKHRHFKLPDDLDDSSVAYLTLKKDKSDVIRLRQYAAGFANTRHRMIHGNWSSFQNKKIYSTWLSKNIPIQFDVCVLSNFLLLVFENDLPLTEEDGDSLEFIEHVIINRLHLKGYDVAPNYPFPGIILYKVARLAAHYRYSGSSSFRKALVTELRKQLELSENKTVRMLMDSSLRRLNQHGSNEQFQLTEKELKGLPVFDATFLSVFTGKIARTLAPLPLFSMRYTCPALTYSLQLENRILRREGR